MEEEKEDPEDNEVAEEEDGNNEEVREEEGADVAAVEVDEVLANIVNVYSDTGYDSRANFNLVGKELPPAEPVIKPKANAFSKSRDSYLRGRTAKDFVKDQEAWKTNHGYRQRWRIETAISTLKMKFDEFVRSISSLAILNEVVTKYLTYNTLCAYRSGP